MPERYAVSVEFEDGTSRRVSICQTVREAERLAEAMRPVKGAIGTRVEAVWS